MASVLCEAYFQDEEAAFERLEGIVWPEGPVCPHCGSMGRAYKLSGVRSKPSKKNPEGILRHGLRKCGECRMQFTVRKGTVFEDSPIPLHVWFQAAYLLCASKKGVSANQLHRTLGVTLQTAWFMGHRLREAMRVLKVEPMGGANKVVEVDETYVGGKETNKHVSKRRAGMQGGKGKEAVIALVERDGKVRSHHVADVTAATLAPILNEQMDKASYVMTDEAKVYPKVMGAFAGHGTVNHSIDEYVRASFWHTNTIEGYFSIMKRGINGVYHHVSKQHLKRYLAEFDFRYNERQKLGVDDMERTARALAGISGKRLTYEGSNKVRG